MSNQVSGESISSKTSSDPAIECGDFYEQNDEPLQTAECHPLGACGDNEASCYQQQHIECQVLRTNCHQETDTIYKHSYPRNCGNMYKTSPSNPYNNTLSFEDPMDNFTIHNLSYGPHCYVPRRNIMRPRDNCLNFKGPLYGMTSQKCDFVPKGFCKRKPIKPIDSICRSCIPLLRNVCRKKPSSESITQNYNYIRPVNLEKEIFCYANLNNISNKNDTYTFDETNLFGPICAHEQQGDFYKF